MDKPGFRLDDIKDEPLNQGAPAVERVIDLKISYTPYQDKTFCLCNPKCSCVGNCGCEGYRCDCEHDGRRWMPSMIGLAKYIVI